MQLSKRIGLFYLISLLILSFSSLFASEGGNCRDVATASANHFAEVPTDEIKHFEKWLELSGRPGKSFVLQSSIKGGGGWTIQSNIAGARHTLELTPHDNARLDIVSLAALVASVRHFANENSKPVDMVIRLEESPGFVADLNLRRTGFREGIFVPPVRALTKMALVSPILALDVLVGYGLALRNDYVPDADIKLLAISVVFPNFLGAMAYFHLPPINRRQYRGTIYPDSSLDLSDNANQNPYAAPRY